MKKVVLPAVGILILSCAAAFAADELPGKEPNQPVVSLSNQRPEPNQKPAPAVAPALQRQRPEMEQMREQARQRTLQRMEQRRQRALQMGAVDANAIAQRRGRFDANLAGRSADANAVRHREEAIKQLLSQQEAKFRERFARLNRIRELAKEQGDVNTVERIDKLIKQDGQLHQIKMQRMSRQMGMMEMGRNRLPGAPRENLVRIEKVKEVNVP